MSFTVPHLVVLTILMEGARQDDAVSPSTHTPASHVKTVLPSVCSVTRCGPRDKTSERGLMAVSLELVAQITLTTHGLSRPLRRCELPQKRSQCKASGHTAPSTCSFTPHLHLRA